MRATHLQVRVAGQTASVETSLRENQPALRLPRLARHGMMRSCEHAGVPYGMRHSCPETPRVSTPGHRRSDDATSISCQSHAGDKRCRIRKRRAKLAATQASRKSLSLGMRGGRGAVGCRAWRAWAVSPATPAKQPRPPHENRPHGTRPIYEFPIPPPMTLGRDPSTLCSPT